MLAQQQVSDFVRYGVLHLPQTVPDATTSAMRDRLWGFLSAMHGRQRDDATTWREFDGGTRFKMLMRTGAFDELRTYLSEPIDEVLGQREWNSPAHWGHPLVTFPNSDREWAIPASGWHVDSSQWSAAAEIPGVVAFTFLDDVKPRGGGTLVLPGSHRVTWQLCQRAGGFMKTSAMKSVLAGEYPWFADLWREPISDADALRRYFDEGVEVDGTHVHVAELCGQPGDVVLMNQRVLHVAAPNVLDSPRMMLSDFIG